jgi:nickel-type superoxide dismutase maturation protease
MLPESTWKERILLLIGRRKGVLVEGNSMLPHLKDGEVVLIKPKSRFQVGDIVLAQHPFKQSVKILKRIAEIDEKGNYVLTGDNPAESTDSRTFGAVSLKCILGKATCRLK